MRDNSVSIYDTLVATQAKTGLSPIFEDAPPRESDHIWRISEMSKYIKGYPEWKGISKNLDFIFNELFQNWIKVYSLDLELQEKDNFGKLRTN